MKKRLFALLLALTFVFSVLPGTVSAAEPAAPGERSGGGVLTAARARVTRLSGLTRTETYAVSDTTRNAVISKIVTGLKNRSAEIDVSGYGLTVQEGYNLYYEVLDAHYEFFYVKSGLSWSYSGSVITALKPVYETTYTNSNVTTFNNLCSSIVAGIPQGTNAEKLLYLHDYLITHCEYDLTYSKTNAYNALVEGSAVCDGYTKAYKVLCDQAGLTCEFVSSDAINHSWNMVQVGGGDTAWYYVDCTWDDPTNGSESSCEHENFLLSKTACAATHKSSDWINGRKESVYANTTSTKYDNYWWKDLNRSVQWVGTKMCYAKSTDFSQVFFRDSGAASETAVTIQGGGNRWYVWGESSYWIDSYITIASQGGAFYYSTPTQIWKLTTGGAMTLTYTLTSAEQAKGYIYGIQSGAGGLTYYIGQKPLQASVASGTLNIPASSASTTPALVSAAASAGQITVKWNAVSGASKYAVYRKTAGGSWKCIASAVTGTTYTDSSTDLAAGTTYYYTVKAYVNGAWSGYDKAGVSATAAAASSTAPVLVSAAASAGQITVKWNAVTNAAKYAVYRKTAGGSWKCINSAVTGTTYKDNSTDLAAGTTYYYTVKAYVSGSWSGYDKAGVSATAK